MGKPERGTVYLLNRLQDLLAAAASNFLRVLAASKSFIMLHSRCTVFSFAFGYFSLTIIVPRPLLFSTLLAYSVSHNSTKTTAAVIGTLESPARLFFVPVATLVLVVRVAVVVAED